MQKERFFNIKKFLKRLKISYFSRLVDVKVTKATAKFIKDIFYGSRKNAKRNVAN